MENSKISWCDHTFNPWIGCTKVSDGCKHCYAESMMDKRFGKVQWGPEGKRILTKDAYWNRPLKWNQEAIRKSRRYRVFCGSLCDIFEEKEDQPELDEWRLRLFQLIMDTPRLDWMLLTKRPENARSWIDRFPWQDLSSAPIGNGYEVFHNVALGTTVENQEQAAIRLPILCQIEANWRFISAEPLLERLDIEKLGVFKFDGNVLKLPSLIDWVIVGGESGEGARPMEIEWAESIVKQCRDSNIPVFIKQLGGHPDKRENIESFPEHLRIREFLGECIPF